MLLQLFFVRRKKGKGGSSSARCIFRHTDLSDTTYFPFLSDKRCRSVRAGNAEGKSPCVAANTRAQGTV